MSSPAGGGWGRRRHLDGRGGGLDRGNSSVFGCGAFAFGVAKCGELALDRFVAKALLLDLLQSQDLGFRLDLQRREVVAGLLGLGLLPAQGAPSLLELFDGGVEVVDTDQRGAGGRTEVHGRGAVIGRRLRYRRAAGCPPRRRR